MPSVPLSGKFDVDSDLRFLTVSKQLVFYRVEEAQISVDTFRREGVIFIKDESGAS
ncbi:hypothetical protein N510_001500 [Firmicutes bacterium ASF500]|nr:hypothetical protein N510_001500 [Firmicutes bacterium ASF500]